MANMSYCMFENTEADLVDCVERMSNARSVSDLDLNEYEKNAFHAMWRACRNFLAEHERLLSAQLEEDIDEMESRILK